MSAQSASLAAIDPKRSRIVITPEGLAIPVNIASRGARIGAFVLDYLFLNIMLVALALILIFIALGSLAALENVDWDDLSGPLQFLAIIFILFAFLSRYGYFLIQELSPRGATLGKRIVGIRVASRTSPRLTAEAIIARTLMRDIEFFVPFAFFQGLSAGQGGGNAGWATAIWFAVFVGFPLFNKDALRAGDLVAGTWVLVAPRMKLAETMSTQSGAGGTSNVTGARYEFGDEELSVYGEHELKTLERVLRDGNDEAVEAVHATICQKVGWNPGAGDERAFLEAFYAQLRGRLEADMRFGKRKADKYS